MLDARTGAGWDYECETTSSDYSAMLGSVAFGVFLGAATGVYYVPVSAPDIVTGIHSNVLFVGDDIFFASRDKLAKIEKSSGKVIWSVLLDIKKSSQSIVFTHANTLYLVNQAFVYLGDGRHYGGKPFFAAFDINTGEKKFETCIEGKDVYIADYLVGENDIVFLYKDKVAKYSLSNGSLIVEKEIKLEKDEKMEFFVDDGYFVETSSGFSNMFDLDPENLYVSTRDDRIFAIRSDLTKGDTIDRKKIYITSFSQPGFKFVNKEDKTVLLDSENKILARLDVPQEAALFGNKLYFRKENKVVEIDLDVFLGKLD